jgi:periplasmic divalent cation tolerance protein
LVYPGGGAGPRAPAPLLILKTTADRLSALQERLCTLHPYAVPEFLVLDVSAVAVPYRDWVVDSTRPT